jgi:hypothetical protein
MYKGHIAKQRMSYTDKKEKEIFLMDMEFRWDRLQKVICEEELPNIRGNARIFNHI